MLDRTRRIAAALLALAVIAGPAGVCTGWMPTAEARMACCSDEGPMHHSEARDGGSKRAVSQAEADRCCATSERDDSARSSSSPASAVSLAAALTGTRVLIPVPGARVDVWRADVQAPARVLRHLLLSVFLV